MLRTKLLLSSVVTGLSLLANSPSLANNAVPYRNVFISYSSPSNVKALASYVQKEHLGGLIFWTIASDTPYSTGPSNSLLAAIQLMYSKVHPPVMAYWTDWSIYSTSTAIPSTPFPVPGSLDDSGKTLQNSDFSSALDGTNQIAYAFLEAQTQNYTYTDSEGKSVTVKNKDYLNDGGTLYFNDPWSDLLASDKHCGAYTSSNPMSKACWYAYYNRSNSSTDPANLAKRGNFDAFAKLSNVKKIMSIGGYGHNDTFEDTFNSTAHINNFAKSAATIINTFDVDGIDLDYENPNMTFKQSDDYLLLIKALRKEIPNKTIEVTMLANPAYLSGTKGNDHGFDSKTGVLKEIAQYADKINLMTYDFHGAFDYNPSDMKSSLTGFLTNLYKPTASDSHLPAGYDPEFSIKSSVNTLENIIGKDNVGKIVVGVPAYGRALAGISSTNHGLFQTINPPSSMIPRGDLDQAACMENITSPLNPNACSGSFSYRYIVNHMLTEGFTTTHWSHRANEQQQPVSSGTTAYADQWTPSATPSSSYQLELSNTGQSGFSKPPVAITIFVATDDSKETLQTKTAIKPGDSETFDGKTTPSTTGVSGKHLNVSWRTSTGAQGVCPGASGSFNFSTPMHVMVAVYGDGQAAGDVACAIQPE